MNVRCAVADDLTAILTLEDEGFDAHERWSEALWAGELDADNRFVLVAGQPATAVAVVQQVGGVAELTRIVVSAAARRTGVGRALLAAVIAAARAAEAEEMLLEVRADNAAALALYAPAGFTEIARRKNYYHGGVDALVLRLDLEEEQ